MKTAELRMIYVTTKDRDQAHTIGRALVEERLAACVNIIDGMHSMYWWEGAVQDEREAVLIAKTRADLVGALTERVKALHSYSVPCVVELPIVGGNGEFLAWIAEETRRSVTAKTQSDALSLVEVSAKSRQVETG